MSNRTFSGREIQYSWITISLTRFKEENLMRLKKLYNSLKIYCWPGKERAMKRDKDKVRIRERERER